MQYISNGTHDARKLPSHETRIRNEDQLQQVEDCANEEKTAAVRKIELPSTLKDSPLAAKRTFMKTYDSAAELYGEGRRARRTAFAALKYSFEKVGDQLKPKPPPGPSDPRATKSTGEKRRGKGTTFGGVDYYGHSKAELYKRARRLRIEGRSNMSKWQLARAIARKQ